MQMADFQYPPGGIFWMRGGDAGRREEGIVNSEEVKGPGRYAVLPSAYMRYASLPPAFMRGVGLSH